MRIIDGISYVCSSDLAERPDELTRRYPQAPWPCRRRFAARRRDARWRHPANRCPVDRACAGTRPKIYSRKIRSIGGCVRSEEHTSELQSLMRTSYAVFCLKNKNNTHKTTSISND